MIDLNDVLLAMSNIPVDDPIAEIWGRGLQGGYKIIEYTGSLPITINANGDALLDYRIYGADGGVGEPTKSGEPAGYKLPMTVQSANLFDKNAQDVNKGFISKTRLNDDGTTQYAYNFNVSEYIAVHPETSYYFRKISTFANFGPAECFYDSEKNFISAYTPRFEESFTVTTPANAAYIRVSCNIANSEQMITEGTEPPPEYIPYSKQTVPVYIGENQLGEDEYVDFGEQKVYKQTENLATMGAAETKTKDGVTITCDGKGTYTLSGTAEKDGNITFVVPKFTMPNINETDFKVCFFNTQIIPNISYGRALVINTINKVVQDTPALSNVTVSAIGFNYTTGFTFDCIFSPSVTIGSAVPSQFVPHIAPTDPPVPLPEIPTIDGETVIDYDGEPKPSQMYVKYKG